MVFSSIGFLFFFFPALLLCYFVVAQWFRTFRNIILLFFSLLFYACSGIRSLPLILCSSLLDYWGGMQLGRTSRPKVWLTIGVVAHLLILFYFKYTAFTISSLNCLGFSISVPEIILPIGISFFTFQGISYLVDVYRKNVAPQTSFLHICLYITLFPQLIAGPIVRYSDVVCQIQNRRETFDEICDGFSRFVVGLGKKVLLSNALAQIADTAFGHTPGTLSTAMAWLGLFAYAGHIYFDFSGYSDMAIGLGHIFGFHFQENFNYPYIACSITDFWRRWHISLSSWFRDYLYIPLGGSRHGVKRTVANLLIVWAATGLWHGAAWTFLVWGLYFGLLLILEKFLWLDRLKHTPKLCQHIYALFFVSLGWVWFRSPDFPSAISYFSALFAIGDCPATEPQVFYWLHQYGLELILTPVVCTPILLWLNKKLPFNSTVVFCIQKVSILLVALISVCRLLSSGFNPFIYFRF